MPPPRATVNKVKAYVGAPARLFLGGMFLLASATKSADLNGLSAAIGQFGLFPSSTKFPLAAAVAAGETLLALILLAGFSVGFSGLLASVALVLMTGLYLPGLLTGVETQECPSFGSLLPMRIVLLRVARHVLLTVLGVLAASGHNGSWSVSPAIYARSAHPEHPDVGGPDAGIALEAGAGLQSTAWRT